MKYTCVSPVDIRREPRIIEYKVGKLYVTNRVGALNLGTQKEVYETLTDKTNTTWGRISAPDATGNAQWVALATLNREFMRRVEEQVLDSGVNPLEQRVASLEQRVASLEASAK